MAPPSIPADVRRQVDRHLAENRSLELGGLLAGRIIDGAVTVLAAIPSRLAVSTERTFVLTEAAWTEMNEALREDHPDLVAVGWYHSHPGLGAHLSEHDRYICSTFFPEPWQLAYVVDPMQGVRSLYAEKGSELVMSEKVPKPRRSPQVRRIRAIGVGVPVLALVIFLLGYFAHSTSPSSRVTFTAKFGDVTMASTITEHGSTVTLTEKFTNTAKKSVTGTVSPCLPNGAVVDSFSHLQIVAPDGCLLDLGAGKTATITGKGPAATVLSGTGPTSFSTK